MLKKSRKNTHKVYLAYLMFRESRSRVIQEERDYDFFVHTKYVVSQIISRNLRDLKPLLCGMFSFIFNHVFVR